MSGAGGAENATDTVNASTVLADRRENHLGDPILKAPRFRFVGAHDQLVEAGFGDEVSGSS